MKITSEMRAIWQKCREKKFIGDLPIEGYFANGDFWCGEKSNEPGFWIAYDKQNRPYETLEMPKRVPIKLDIAIGFVGEYIP